MKPVGTSQTTKARPLHGPDVPVYSSPALATPLQSDHTSRRGRNADLIRGSLNIGWVRVDGSALLQQTESKNGD